MSRHTQALSALVDSRSYRGLGRPWVLTDATGQPAWRVSYQAFREAPSIPAARQASASLFPGQYLDAESGLHYNRFRYYDPEVGRYLNADPLGQWDDSNVYQYLYNNPLVGYDPFGLNNFGGPIQPRPSRDSYIKIYRDAARTARQEFPDPPDIPPGMESAARIDFRHCLAACELSRQHSHLESKILGDLNECIYGEDPEGEDLFDKAANEVGRRIADKAESREDCVAGCRSAARLGRPFSPPVPSSWP